MHIPVTVYIAVERATIIIMVQLSGLVAVATILLISFALSFINAASLLPPAHGDVPDVRSLAGSTSARQSLEAHVSGELLPRPDEVEAALPLRKRQARPRSSFDNILGMGPRRRSTSAGPAALSFLSSRAAAANDSLINAADLPPSQASAGDGVLPDGPLLLITRLTFYSVYGS